MGSDYDFINEHMGGHNEDGMPNFMNSPCFNDDWEQMYLNGQSYKTVQEWNKAGRTVKKGENGKFLPCAKKRVFLESQTEPSKFQNSSVESSNYFDNLEEATNWAKKNIGKVITRSPDGKGYISKK